MKVGGGLAGLVSNNVECSSRQRWFFLRSAALLALGLSLTLIGCGELSLNRLLENQEPGELGITPKTATVDTESIIEISGKGGFKPYTYSAVAGSFEEIDGYTYYKAPSTATTETIMVKDMLSSEATATIEVVGNAGLSFPHSMTVAIGENTGYVLATGGSGSYHFWLEGDGRLEFHATRDDRVKYYADVSEPMTVFVKVEDLGTLEQRTLTVTVVEAGGG